MIPIIIGIVNSLNTPSAIKPIAVIVSKIGPKVINLRPNVEAMTYSFSRTTSMVLSLPGLQNIQTFWMKTP